MKLCYNCGITLTKDNSSKEHVPPQGLFAGYSDVFKINRITVPACKSCNNEYSKYDEVFRNWIGNMAANPQVDEITRRTISSLIRANNFDILEYIPGIGLTMEFKREFIERFHTKNFKALFYHSFGFVIPSEFTFYVIYDEANITQNVNEICDYLKYFPFSYSGHPDVFEYVISPIRDGEFNTSRLTPNNEDNCFAGLLIYNKSHAPMIIAIRESAKQSPPPSH